MQSKHNMHIVGKLTMRLLEIPPAKHSTTNSSPQVRKTPHNMSNLEILSIADLERAAHGKMDKMTREYYNSGADSEITQAPHQAALREPANVPPHSLRDNLASFDRYKLRPRYLKDVSSVDTTTKLWGRKVTKTQAPFFFIFFFSETGF